MKYIVYGSKNQNDSTVYTLERNFETKSHVAICLKKFPPKYV